MYKLLLALSILLICSCNRGNGQQTSENKYVQGEVQNETPATFKYGENGLQLFISKNLVIPHDAMHYGINGSVDVEFMIDENGKVVSVRALKENFDVPDEVVLPQEVVKSLKGIFAIEAERVIWLTDTLWTPATKLDRIIPSSQVISFNFQSKQYADNLDRIGKGEPVEFGIFTQGYVDPTPVNHYQIGVRLMLDGFFGEAGKHLSYSLLLNPNQTDAWFNLALCYKKLNLLQEACDAWQKAADLGDQEAQQLIEQNCQ